jgi:hypothetical protein
MVILNQGSSSMELFLEKSFPSPRKILFSGFKGENPYNQLRSFEQLCSTHSCSDLSPDKFRVRLFPFSLAGEAKAWYFQQEKVGEGLVLPAREGLVPQIGEIYATSSALGSSPYLVS